MSDTFDNNPPADDAHDVEFMTALAQEVRTHVQEQIKQSLDSNLMAYVKSTDALTQSLNGLIGVLRAGREIVTDANGKPIGIKPTL
jgi:hypothetical protein